AAGVAHAVPARGNPGTGAGTSAAGGAAAPAAGSVGAGWDGLQLWYPRPATQWVEALPLGNGRLGAMVWGGGKHERIQLNEDTLYAGGPYDPTPDRKSTRLNSSHVKTSYAVFCLK